MRKIPNIDNWVRLVRALIDPDLPCHNINHLSNPILCIRRWEWVTGKILERFWIHNGWMLLYLKTRRLRLEWHACTFRQQLGWYTLYRGPFGGTLRRFSSERAFCRLMQIALYFGTSGFHPIHVPKGTVDGVRRLNKRRNMQIQWWKSSIRPTRNRMQPEIDLRALFEFGTHLRNPSTRGALQYIRDYSWFILNHIWPFIAPLPTGYRRRLLRWIADNSDLGPPIETIQIHSIR